MNQDTSDAAITWAARREPWVQQKDDIRSPYGCDLERVLHSRSFRSLQGKTQVLSPDRAGLHRTRLTHTLEVAEIAGQVMHQVAGDIEQGEPDADLLRCLAHLPPSDLVRTIALAHDLGHPPFGHDGEKALASCMASHGGFEANGQTLRILARLETSSREAGANLTRRTLLGVLKYPAPAGLLRHGATAPAKGHFDCEQDVVDWILAPLTRRDRELFTAVETIEGRPPRTVHRSLDCSIMDVADDIAYGVHDVEDALTLGLIDEAAFRLHVTSDVCVEHLDRLGHGYAQEGGSDGYERMVAMLFGDHGERGRALSRIRSTLIVTAAPYEVEGFEEPLLSYRVDLPPFARRFLEALHALILETVIRGTDAVASARRNMAMVATVFDGAMQGAISSPRLQIFGKGTASTCIRARAVCDLIAAMDERHLVELHGTLER